MVQLRNASRRRRGSAYKLVALKETLLPHGLITNGVIEQPEKVRKYIRHLLERKAKNQKRIATSWVVASIPDNHGFIKLIQLDKEPDDLIEEDIISAAKKHVPLDEGTYYLDWQIMPDHDKKTDHTEVLISTTPKTISEMYTYLLESLGLVVVALELKALATARAMITARKRYEGEARAILDIGATESTMIVYDHDHIQFSRSLSHSGEALTAAIAQKYHLPYGEAETEKRRLGLEYKNSRLWPLMIKLTDQLIKEVGETIYFYYSHFPHTNKVKHITMCGGGSNLKRLDKILSVKLKIATKPGNVWKNLSSSTPITLDQESSLRFATAVGLALRAADNPYFSGDII